MHTSASSDLAFLSLGALKSLLDSKEISAVELTSFFLDRIAHYDPHINSFISVFPEQALLEAQKADALRASLPAEQRPPLLGLPLAHKDIFCTQGQRTSAASKMLDNFKAPYHATLVDKLQKAGTILLGKTNMDEFAMGSSNETSFYGPVHNPWDLSCVPGGSSGGSAAAVAAALVPCSTGTDTGGSIRQPAALCNLVGLKPTYGRISRYGMIAFASSLDQAGSFTRTVEDAARLLEVMAGVDPRDATSVAEPVPAYHQALNRDLKGLRIGLPSAFFNADLPSEIAACLEHARVALEKEGAICVDIELPHLAHSVAVYYVLASAECSSNLSRYDGVRYGHRSTRADSLQTLYTHSRSEAFGPEVKRRILIGSYVLSAGYYDAYYAQAQKVRQLIHQDFQRAFERVDLILGPTTPNTAFKLGDKMADPIAMYLQDIYTIAVNLAGLPALSLPCGFVDQRPVGMQLIAPAFQEQRLLNVGYAYQQLSDWHQYCPPLFTKQKD